MSVYLNVRAIRVRMLEMDLSGVKLAELANVSRQTISTALHRGSCSTATARALAAALEMTISEIIKED